MRGYHDYPRRNRVAIVFGVILVLIGVGGIVNEYLAVGWWRVFIDQIRDLLAFMLPFALILLGAWLVYASRKGVLVKAVHPKEKRVFARSRSDRRVFGVCGGFAASRQVDVFYVRVAVLLLLLAFPLLTSVAYILVTVLTPSE